MTKKKKIKAEDDFRCGMVSIVGRPNVGKSTLVNKILQEKISIVSKVPQTTRNQVRGIYNDDRGQIIFIDTPGLHVGKDKLDKFMNKSAYGTVDDADCIVHLVDTRDAVGKEEHDIVGRLNKLKCPIILGLNKVDIKGKYIPDYIALWEEIKGQPITEMKGLTLLPLSAKNEINIDKLIDILMDALPKSRALYPRDSITDVPRNMVIADVIREKLFSVLQHEIPHSVAVVVENVQQKRKNIVHIQSLILVERDSQKQIVIGKDGQLLKKVGTLARKDLESLLECKVYLEMFVKTMKNWRDNNAMLQEMGYQSL